MVLEADVSSSHTEHQDADVSPSLIPINEERKDPPGAQLEGQLTKEQALEMLVGLEK